MWSLHFPWSITSPISSLGITRRPACVFLLLISPCYFNQASSHHFKWYSPSFQCLFHIRLSGWNSGEGLQGWARLMLPKHSLLRGAHLFKSHQRKEDDSHQVAVCPTALLLQMLWESSWWLSNLFSFATRNKHVAPLAWVAARLVFWGMCFCSSM